MSSPSTVERFKPHAVPLVVFALVVVAALVVPPLVLGEVTARTYALTAAVLIIAVGAAFPYAVLVALGTLPFLYAGVASFAAPEPAADVAHPFSVGTVLRHGVAGVAYVLGAAAVGAIGIGVNIAVGSDSTTLPVALQPVFLYLGGVIVAVAFVNLQLWRYDTPLDALTWRTVLGTIVLGVLLAFSPVIAFWRFNGTV